LQNPYVHRVMAGLVPAIHVDQKKLQSARMRPDVDAPNKSGHDGKNVT
jgi:hypothetical protein